MAARLILNDTDLLNALALNYQQGVQIMAAIDDLKTAVTNLNTSVSNELAAIATKLSGAASAADVETQVTALNTLKATIDNETASLTAAPPAPAPAPAAAP
jgi:hypothetical protein